MSEDPSVAAGRRQLRRLETFLDVAYAVLFVDFIMYLPHTEDMAWEALPYGLLSLLLDNSTDLLRLIIAVGLTLISWNLTHKLLGPLDRILCAQERPHARELERTRKRRGAPKRDHRTGHGLAEHRLRLPRPRRLDRRLVRDSDGLGQHTKEGGEQKTTR